ncbi:hypothetical protein O181_012535 [Austropuccinia psidii MF-1]|uniref:Uncharacterized protein n=1 Tax=Austropuccinia psidii MF-1 TaxID=1389203 RepID=A0A9Q3BX99_9BASI|nr:hypothetical protein [Austropuccinia psidii MF-1]
MPASNVKGYLWSKKDGPVGKEFPVSEAPIPYGTSGYSNLTGSKQREVARWTNVGGPILISGGPIYSSSEVPSSRINTEGLVKKIRQISDPSTNPDGEEIPKSSSTQYPQKFTTSLSTIPSSIPPPSPSPSTARHALVSTVRPSPIPQPKNLPTITIQQHQPVSSSSRRRED